MNIFKILYKIYIDLFHVFIGSEDEKDITVAFNDLQDFHSTATVESEDKLKSFYAKVFKSKIFLFLSPIVYFFLKYLATKYTHPEYINRLIEKEMEE